jgi:hypothetical protein
MRTHADGRGTLDVMGFPGGLDNGLIRLLRFRDFKPFHRSHFRSRPKTRKHTERVRSCSPGYDQRRQGSIIQGRRSIGLQEWVLSVNRSIAGNRVEATVLKQSRQIESYVPSALLRCWKDAVVEADWMAIGMAFFRAPERPQTLN